MAEHLVASSMEGDAGAPWPAEMDAVKPTLRMFAGLGGSVMEHARLVRYLASGRRPWTPGYEEYKRMMIKRALKDEELIRRFRADQELPARYGRLVDERIVEYPWVLSRLPAGPASVIDAGGTLNDAVVLGTRALRNKTVIAYDLVIDGAFITSHSRCVCGDLRRVGINTASIDEIVCISTLEHVGMNNAFLYARDDPRFDEHRPNEYRLVVREFARLLKPNGKLLITVPYGRYEDHGWLQQFGLEQVKMISQVFEPSDFRETYFEYGVSGWRISTSAECRECRYHDVHSARGAGTDGAAAARAVACLELVK